MRSEELLPPRNDMVNSATFFAVLKGHKSARSLSPSANKRIWLLAPRAFTRWYLFEQRTGQRPARCSRHCRGTLAPYLFFSDEVSKAANQPIESSRSTRRTTLRQHDRVP